MSLRRVTWTATCRSILLLISCLLGTVIVGDGQVMPEPGTAPVSAMAPQNAPEEIDLAALQATLQPLIAEIQKHSEAGESIEAARKQSRLVDALILALGTEHDFVWQGQNEIEFHVSQTLQQCVEIRDYTTAFLAIRLLKHLQPDSSMTESQQRHWSELFLLRWCLNQDHLAAAADVVPLLRAEYEQLAEQNLQRLEMELLIGQLAERQGDYVIADQHYQHVEQRSNVRDFADANHVHFALLHLEALAGRTQVATMRGDWNLAGQHCRTWRSAAKSLGPAGVVSSAESWLAEAAVLRYSGSLAEAGVVCRKVLVQLEALANTAAPPHLLTAVAWNELSLVQALLGEPQAAHQSALTAWQIYTAILGPDAPVVTRLEGNLAELARQLPLEARQQFEGFLEQALERAQASSATPPRVLATLRQTAGRYAELDQDWNTAREHFAAAVEIRSKTLGEHHHATARARHHLAICHLALGQLETAEHQLQASLKAFTVQLGPRHVDTALVIADLGLLAELRRDFDLAEQNYRDALQRLQLARVRIGVRGLDAVGLSESALVSTRLATLLASQGHLSAATLIWQQSLGASLREEVALRQLRTLRPEEFTALRDLEDQLSQITAQFDRTLNTNAATPEQILALRQQQDRILALLAEQKQRLVQAQADGAVLSDELRPLQQAIAVDEAIVGWVSRQDSLSTVVPQHWGVVLRAEGTPRWVALSEGNLTDLAARLREGMARTDFTPLEEFQPLAETMQRVAWEPLAESFSAVGQQPPVRRLTVMPSPGMQGVPVNLFAEPTQRVTYVPSGAIYQWLQQRNAQRTTNSAVRLLALGDPEFVSPDRVSSLHTRNRWPPLPGTRQEVQAIAAAGVRRQCLVTSRLGADARESLLAKWAKADELKEYRWLHFATHGEANPNLPLRSRLILAHEPVSDESDGEAQPDGDFPSELTAEMILRTWNLQAEVVTLSACESGLGRFTATEGYVGFSQALLLAGSQAVVSSLWKVDDFATALLMTRFYENLFGARDALTEPLPLGEALHEAQAWLRELTEGEQRQLLEQLQRSEPLQTDLITRSSSAPTDLRPYAHPHYWAAFVLIGAPRD